MEISPISLKLCLLSFVITLIDNNRNYVKLSSNFSFLITFDNNKITLSSISTVFIYLFLFSNVAGSHKTTTSNPIVGYATLHANLFLIFLNFASIDFITYSHCDERLPINVMYLL
jgi:TM2 domain-containing membrane protein YozV